MDMSDPNGVVGGLEKLIEKMPGVKSAKIIAGPDGRISEVHVLSDSSRSPKQIVRDIQSAAAAAFDIAIDHKVISVAQLEHLDTERRDRRLKLGSMSLTSDGRSLSVDVTLLSGDRSFQGSAQGTVSSSGRLFAAAQACISAVNNYLGKDDAFSVADCQRIRIAGGECLITAVSYSDGRDSCLLLGTCLLKDDEYRAVVKSALDAVNRTLSKAFCAT